MTDYLTNLLDRAFDRATVIQPPRASLFASLTSGARSAGYVPFAAHAQADTVETIGETESDHLRSHRAPQPSRQNSSRRRHDVETFNEPSAGEPRRAAKLDAPRRETIVNPTPVAPARSVPVDANAEAKSSPRENDLEPDPLETIRVPEAARPEAARVDEEGLLAKMRALIPKPSPVAPSPEDDRAETKSSPMTVVETRAPAPEKFEERAFAQRPSVTHDKPDEGPPSPPTLPSLSPSPPPPSAPAASPLSLHPATTSPASPTIQVTIGRIEVRASSATPQQQRKPAGGPRLTLEAYLRQRDGHNGGAQ